MKTETVSNAACMATILLVVALCVPNDFSQGRPITVVRGPQRTGSVPSTGPTPMDNPVGRMTNPVQPIIQSPSMPHPAATPTVVIPNLAPGGVFHGVGYRHGLRIPARNPVIFPVYAQAPYYAPFYDPYYFGQIPTVITIPGLLPGARYEDYRGPRYEGNRGTIFNLDPYTPPATSPANTFIYASQPEPEPRMIIREPQPDRVVQPPAVGVSRADVIMQLGQPWGRFIVRGIETLYFDDVTVVLGRDGRVTSTR